MTLAAGLVVAALAGCATPSQRFDRSASELGFVRHNVPGTQFEHAVYQSSDPRSGPLLHVYLEGDASPRMASRYSPPDPTPHRPQMLELMALDQAPSLLLGRPCQHGLDPDCDPALWTIGRYGENVVASLVAALRRELHAMGVSGRSASGVVLVGYSGGGTLALLMAEHLPETRAVITLAGNLDTGRWAEHHGYVPLLLSLDPAERPPLDASIVQIHLLGGRDERVPPFLTEAVIARQKGAKLHQYPRFDHECCWASVWRATLAELDVLLEEPLDR
jgi:pimeloyl-ACP methyl ester carboxylesterase